MPRCYLKFTNRAPFYTSAEIHLDEVTSQMGEIKPLMKSYFCLTGFLLGFVLVEVVGSLVHQAASVW